jgi:hypothetical protein
MSRIRRRPNLKTIIATLRLRVAQGDLSAMCNLGMWLQEGLQDRKGRRFVDKDLRRHAKCAVHPQSGRWKS